MIGRGSSARLRTTRVAALELSIALALVSLPPRAARAAFEIRPGGIGVSSHLPEHLSGALDPVDSWSAGQSMGLLHLRPFGASSLAVDAAAVALSDSTRCVRLILSRLGAPGYSEWIGTLALARRWHGTVVRAEASSLVTQAGALEPGRRPESLATTSLGFALRRELPFGAAIEGWVRDARTGADAKKLGLARRAGARLELSLAGDCELAISGTRGGRGGEARIGLRWRAGAPLTLEHAWRNGAVPASTALGFDLPRVSTTLWSAVPSPGLPATPGVALSVRGRKRAERSPSPRPRPIEEAELDLITLWREGEGAAGAFDPTSLDSLRAVALEPLATDQPSDSREDPGREARVRRYLTQVPPDREVAIAAVPESLRADLAAVAPYLEEEAEPRVAIAPAEALAPGTASGDRPLRGRDLRLILQRTHRAALGRDPSGATSASLGLGLRGGALAAGWRGEGRAGWLRVEGGGAAFFAGRRTRGLRWGEGLVLRRQPPTTDATFAAASGGSSLAARVPLAPGISAMAEVHSAGGTIALFGTRGTASLGVLTSRGEVGPDYTSLVLGRRSAGLVARVEAALAPGVRPQYAAGWRVARLWGRLRVGAELGARDGLRRVGAALSDERELRATVSGRGRIGGVRAAYLSATRSERRYASAWFAPASLPRIDLDWTETQRGTSTGHSVRDDLRLSLRRLDWTLELARSRTGTGRSGYRGHSLAWSPASGFALGVVDTERAGSNSPSWLGLRERLERGVHLGVRGEARYWQWSLGLRALGTLVGSPSAQRAELRVQWILGRGARAG
ncbi:MAG: hypothetical protein IPK72_13150 [Candidatus Eisenbacteria bacterium]|nr:hypothetical protein [Candidatus Eisenbacteria bacterium]